jgi:hypothetical protein
MAMMSTHGVASTNRCPQYGQTRTFGLADIWQTGQVFICGKSILHVSWVSSADGLGCPRDCWLWPSEFADNPAVDGDKPICEDFCSVGVFPLHDRGWWALRPPFDRFTGRCISSLHGNGPYIHHQVFEEPAWLFLHDHV